MTTHKKTKENEKMKEENTELRATRAKLAILELRNDPEEMRKIQKLLVC